MKEIIQAVIKEGLQCLSTKFDAIQLETIELNIDNSKDKSHGDYASNIALQLAKPLKSNPRLIAEQLIEAMPSHEAIKAVKIAGPGFINFFLNCEAKAQVILEILEKGAQYGYQAENTGQRINLEYVSANPTGPLHVGHGRGAAVGSSLANLLKSQGHIVSQEYYVNDAGRQMDILAASVYIRYLQLLEHKITFPLNGYQGDYVLDIAKKLHELYSDTLAVPLNELTESLPDDTEENKELYIDAFIQRSKDLLGHTRFHTVHQLGLNDVLNGIKTDLEAFGVYFDRYFSENSLFEQGDINKGIKALQEKGRCYESDGALWFKSTELGDDKDRVLKRQNGVTTYFTSDVAYLWNKYDRSFEQLIYLFGADHHGYVARIKAAANTLGFDETAMQVLLIQFVALYRGQTLVPMSTRSGSYVTLSDLQTEVGRDPARFFYVMRKSNQHMDFDLELAKSQSNENPVYYVQYAHARIASIFRMLNEESMPFDRKLANLTLLSNEHEQSLMNLLQRYPEMLSSAARDQEPHQVANFVRELAKTFHTYYNALQFIVEDSALRNARLCLIKSVQLVIANGLAILGVSAPEQM